MFGIELVEFIAFGKQVGVVIAGAAAFWGFVFWVLHRKNASTDSGQAYGVISKRLLLPYFTGVGIATLCWLVLENMLPAYAHEGIVLQPELLGIYAALDTFFPLFALWVGISICGGLWLLVRRHSFFRALPWFYAITSLCTLILASFPVWTGVWSREQFFFIGHNVHSIFTFGTVLMLDYLFVVSQTSRTLQQYIFPKFFIISKVIWVGLALDFISVALVFEDAIQFTPKFFFMQMVIGILIINGVILAGPIARRMIASVQKGATQLPKHWKLTAEIAGAISISSWFSNTFVDFFHGLTLQYLHFVLLYIALIATAFFGHMLFEKFFLDKFPKQSV